MQPRHTGSSHASLAAKTLPRKQQGVQHSFARLQTRMNNIDEEGRRDYLATPTDSQQSFTTFISPALLPNLQRHDIWPEPIEAPKKNDTYGTFLYNKLLGNQRPSPEKQTLFTRVLIRRTASHIDNTRTEITHLPPRTLQKTPPDGSTLCNP